MPVKTATGVMHKSIEDFSMTGKVDLDWIRYYDTDLSDTASSLGIGWTSRYFCRLIDEEESYFFTNAQGQLIEFDNSADLLTQKGIIRNSGDFSELHQTHSHFIVTQWDIDTGDVWQFQFPIEENSIGLLQSITEPTGQGIELAYNNKSQLVGIRQKLEKRTLILRYNAQNLIQAIDFLHPNKKIETLIYYHYDQQDRLIRVTDAANQSDYFEYDHANRIIRERSKDASMIDYTYDELGRCIHSTGIGGYDEKSLHFIDNAGWIEVTDSEDIIRRYQRNENNQIVQEITAMGSIYQTDYDSDGRIIAKTDPNGAITRYEFDSQGNRCAIIDALGQVSHIKYNTSHLPTQFTNTAGHIWYRFYDQNHYLISTEDPEGHRYQLQYDKKGNLLNITDPLGNTLRQNFNGRGILQAASDWLGHITRYQTDHFGRLTQITDPLGHASQYHYDVMGNLIRVEYPDRSENSYQYDAGGNLVHLIDRNGQTTNYKYGHCGRLIERIDALGQQMHFGWGNEPDRLEAVTNAKREVYHFEYNAAGWVIAEIGFDGRELQFEYDLAGNRIAHINGLQQRIDYKRDALGRLTKQLLPDQLQTTFSYDIAGFLATTTNNASHIQFTRDKLGRIISEDQNGHIIKRDYDAVNNLNHLQSDLGAQIDYRFDANGLLQQFQLNQHEATILERDANGAETRRTLSGQINLHQQHDEMGRLQQQAVVLGSHIDASSAFESPQSLIKRSYRYDKAHLVGISDQQWGETTYVYDPLERLTDVLKTQGISEHFLYDANNNLVSIEQASKQSDLHYAKGDRLENKGNTEYHYDTQGRLIEKIEKQANGNHKIWQYKWDALDQLQMLTRPDGKIWHYAYDSFGRRIEKKSPNGVKFGFIWDGDVLLHETTDNNLAVNWVFDPHSFAPLCKEEAGKIYSIITDHLGTPQEMIDRYGDIVWHVDHYAWGKIRDYKKNEVDCPVRFQGQWCDNESGLYYNRFRYYIPDIGNFTTQDPIGLIGGSNFYQYVLNPIHWLDALGLCPSRKGAFKKAKRDAGIGSSQQPIKQKNGKLYRMVGMESKGVPIRYESGSKKGQQIMTREYDFINKNNKKITIQDHSAGHKFGDKNNIGDEGAHFNVRPTGEPRGNVDGTEAHYNFNK